MGLLDKIGDVFEDVTDAVVDAAPIILPIAMQYFFPQMNLVGRQALGAGIGSLIRGDKAETALKAAALGGTLGAIQGGIGSTMSGGTFGEGFGRAFRRHCNGHWHHGPSSRVRVSGSWAADKLSNKLLLDH